MYVQMWTVIKLGRLDEVIHKTEIAMDGWSGSDWKEPSMTKRMESSYTI